MSGSDDLNKILQDQSKGLLPFLIKKYFQDRPEDYAALQNVGNNINKFRTNPEVIAVAENISVNFQKVVKFLSDPNTINTFKLFLELPEKRRAAILNMSEKGWFPFEESLGILPLASETIDEYMTRVIGGNYDDLKIKLLEGHPERGEILKCAFKLIEDGNDIAAIPLLLTQVDGISKDLFGMYYFTGSRIPIKKSSLPVHLKGLGNKIGEHSYDLLKSIIDNSNKAYISDGFEKQGEDINQLTILNRSGILHGDKNFLKYSEKPNVYKVLSLLLYVDWMSDLLNEEK